MIKKTYIYILLILLTGLTLFLLINLIGIAIVRNYLSPYKLDELDNKKLAERSYSVIIKCSDSPIIKELYLKNEMVRIDNVMEEQKSSEYINLGDNLKYQFNQYKDIFEEYDFSKLDISLKERILLFQLEPSLSNKPLSINEYEENIINKYVINESGTFYYIYINVKTGFPLLLEKILDGTTCTYRYDFEIDKPDTYINPDKRYKIKKIN